MAKYFEVVNDKNILQLNDSWEDISFLRKHTISNWQKIHSDRWRCILSISERPAFWFMYNSSNFPVNVIFFTNKDKGKLSRKFDVMLPNGTNTQPSLEFYLFGFKSKLESSREGFEIYNENGRKIFSTAEHYLKILDTFLPAQAAQVNENFKWNTPSGKKVAVHMPSLPTVLSEGAGDGFSTFSELGVKLGPYNSYISVEWNTEFGPDFENESDIYEEAWFKSMWTIADITGI